MTAGLKKELIYAGFWKRVAANIVDGLVLTLFNLIVVYIPIGFSVGVVLAACGIDLDSARGTQIWIFAIIIACCIVQLLYYAFFESSSKQGTPGKQAMKIIVVDHEFKRVSFIRAAGRAILMIIPLAIGALSETDTFLFIGIGIYLCIVLPVAWTRQSQGLHDILTGCLVVNRDFVSSLETKENAPDAIPAIEPGQQINFRFILCTDD